MCPGAREELLCTAPHRAPGLTTPRHYFSLPEAVVVLLSLTRRRLAVALLLARPSAPVRLDWEEAMEVRLSFYPTVHVQRRFMHTATCSAVHGGMGMALTIFMQACNVQDLCAELTEPLLEVGMLAA